jgi:hypothetical protein
MKDDYYAQGSPNGGYKIDGAFLVFGNLKLALDPILLGGNVYPM